MAITEHAPATEREQLLTQADDAARQADNWAEHGDGGAAVWMEIRALRLTLAAAAATPQEPGREQKPEIEEGWYQIELFGHRSRNGYLRTVSLGGRQLLEIREPEHVVNDDGDEQRLVEERVEFYASSAVFSLSPSTETDVVKELADLRPF